MPTYREPPVRSLDDFPGPAVAGRTTASNGPLEPIPLGTGLAFQGGALANTSNGNGNGSSVASIGDLIDVDIGDKANNSLLVFSASQNKFITSPAITTSTITDGGNF